MKEREVMDRTKVRALGGSEGEWGGRLRQGIEVSGEREPPPSFLKLL